MIYEFIVDVDLERLDTYLTSKTELTRSYLHKLIIENQVTVNGQIIFKCGRGVRRNDKIILNVPEPKVTIEKKDIPIDIIYNDSDICVINKQQGLTVHPANGNYDNTLVNALMYHIDSLSGINGVKRPGIVHRLDKDTSGVMVVAKNDKAHLSLASQIEGRTIKKYYVALLEGNLKQDSGVVENCIGRNPKDRKKMAVVDGGRLAISKYTVIQRYKSNCLVLFNILTGRTHQIRVHAQYLGHPVVGDLTYGFSKQRFKLNGQLLHAYQLEFCHPRTGEQLKFNAPLPDYYKEVLNTLMHETYGINFSEQELINQIQDKI